MWLSSEYCIWEWVSVASIKSEFGNPVDTGSKLNVHNNLWHNGSVVTIKIDKLRDFNTV